VANEVARTIADEAKTIHKLPIRLFVSFVTLRGCHGRPHLTLGIWSLTMSKELGATSQQDGIAAGIFFIG